jgi:uncharacterized protein YvpB
MAREPPSAAAQRAPTLLLRQGPPEWLRGGTLLDCAVGEAGLLLSSSTGSYTSEELAFEVPARRIVLSWQATAPGAARLELELRARLAGEGAWSSWIPAGRWGAGTTAASGGRQRFPGATLDVDAVIAPPGRSFDAAQYRVQLHGDGAQSPLLSLVALLAFTPGLPLPLQREPSPAWGRVLDVPQYSQLAEDPRYAWEICSPTSLTMVLGYFGRQVAVREVVEGVYDHAADIYGAWPLNTAFASSLGVPMLVARFERMEQLEEEIAAGRPVILSHRWLPGELEGASIPSSSGHVVVAVGFTLDGDLVVNDPLADPQAAEPVRRVYRRQDIHQTWLRRGSGIVYAQSPAIRSPAVG